MTAIARFFIAGNAAVRRASPAGAISALPMPCTTRPAMSIGTSGESAHMTAPMTMTTLPMIRMRLRPKRSASAPERIKRAASAST